MPATSWGKCLPRPCFGGPTLQPCRVVTSASCGVFGPRQGRRRGRWRRQRPGAAGGLERRRLERPEHRGADRGRSGRRAGRRRACGDPMPERRRPSGPGDRPTGTRAVAAAEGATVASVRTVSVRLGDAARAGRRRPPRARDVQLPRALSAAGSFRATGVPLGRRPCASVCGMRIDKELLASWQVRPDLPSRGWVNLTTTGVPNLTHGATVRRPLGAGRVPSLNAPSARPHSAARSSGTQRR